MRNGVTLIELLVVTVIIALMASLTLPVSQIIKQREKETRLREILNQVRSALNTGTNEEGYSGYISRQILQTSADAASKSTALASAATAGVMYILNPNLIENPILTSPFNSPPPGYTFKIVVPVNYSFPIKIEQRFIRKIPPHPFTGWYPGAHWEFKAAADSSGGTWYASGSWPTTATGVMSIRSRGAGLALNGENTDDW